MKNGHIQELLRLEILFRDIWDIPVIEKSVILGKSLLQFINSMSILIMKNLKWYNI